MNTTWNALINSTNLVHSLSRWARLTLPLLLVCFFWNFGWSLCWTLNVNLGIAFRGEQNLSTPTIVGYFICVCIWITSCNLPPVPPCAILIICIVLCRLHEHEESHVGHQPRNHSSGSEQDFPTTLLWSCCLCYVMFTIIASFSSPLGVIFLPTLFFVCKSLERIKHSNGHGWS